MEYGNRDVRYGSFSLNRILRVSIPLLAILSWFAGPPAKASAAQRYPSSPSSPANSNASASAPLSTLTFVGAVPSWASAGATLSVYSWPSLSGAQVGQTFDLPLAGQESVNGANFLITLPQGPGINYQFVISNGTQTVSTLTPGDARLPIAASVPIGNPSMIPSLVVQGSRRLPAWTSISMSKSRESSHNVTSRYTLNGCQLVDQQYLGEETIKVGEAHTASTTTGTFVYGSDTADAIGVGISASGTYGTYSSAGTYSEQAGLTGSTPVAAGQHVEVGAKFYDANFAEYCGPKGEFMGIVEVPYQFYGPVDTLGSAGTNPSGSCPVPPSAELDPGHTVSFSFGSTVTNGYQLSIMGFNFNESSTWGTSTSMSWTASPSAPVTGLCGPGQTFPSGQSVIYNSAL